MGLLVFSLRKQQLLRRKSDIEYRQVELAQKMNDLKSYTDALGAGQISLNSFMGVSGSLFGRLQGLMNFSNQMAMSQANSQFNAMMQMPGAQQQFQQMTGGNAQAIQWYSNMFKQQLYQNAMQSATNCEKQMLNSQENQVQSQLSSMDEELKMVNQELESIDKAYDEDVKYSVPKYA